MVKLKKVGGRYGMHSGSAKFRNLEVDRNFWVQGNVMPFGLVKGTVWYVDGAVAASGDGQSWDTAFKTITEGIAALTNYDALLIAPGNYDEAATNTLSNLKGVRIIGASTGMQWGEGSTNWRSVTSTDDILNITGCQGCEIAGIGFIQITADKDAINFTGLNYSIHIHDCCFIGDVGSGTVMAYGVNIAGSNGPDTYIHDCKFFRVKTAAIQATGQRNVIENNIFILPANGKAITLSNAASDYAVIASNLFMGASSGDTGIYYTAMTQNNYMIANNRFAGVATPVSTTLANVDESYVDNYMNDTTGGILAVDPGDTG